GRVAEHRRDVATVRVRARRIGASAVQLRPRHRGRRGRPPRSREVPGPRPDRAAGRVPSEDEPRTDTNGDVVVIPDRMGGVPCLRCRADDGRYYRTSGRDRRIRSEERGGEEEGEGSSHGLASRWAQRASAAPGKTLSAPWFP